MDRTAGNRLGEDRDARAGEEIYVGELLLADIAECLHITSRLNQREDLGAVKWRRCSNKK